MSANDNVIPFPGRWHGTEDEAPAVVDPLASPGDDPRRTPVVEDPPTQVRTLSVHVELDETAPAVWRDLDLAGDTTLEQLDDIIQIAMGWQGAHLHSFSPDSAHPRHLVQPFLTDFDIDEGEQGVHERDVRLDQVLHQPGDRLFYSYDFGDGWEHIVSLMGTLPRVGDEAVRARCTSGSRACPPEDCGGPAGYDALVTALAAPEQADSHGRMLLDWLAEDYDPDAFSADAVNERLGAVLRPHTLPPLASLPPALHEMLSASGTAARSPLTGLVSGAGLTEHPEVTRETREEVGLPYLRLLELVGEEALLTSAGYLKPAMVTELARVVWVESIGKANREDQTWPVAALRASATSMGLVRKNKGRLLPTKVGKALAGDVDRMWEHLVQTLPLGREKQYRHGGTIALLALACDVAPIQLLREQGPEIMARAGWQRTDIGGPPPPETVFDSARPTLDVLQVTGAVVGLRQVTPRGQALARCALRHG